jgi:tetratricopeptide (TPR) repeat protein
MTIPKEAKKHFEKGLAASDDQEAVEELSKAIVIAPDYVDALMYRAITFTKLGDKQQSFTDINSAIQIMPENALPYYYRAVIYAKTLNGGSLQPIIDDLNTVIELNPNFAPAYSTMAEIQELIGNVLGAFQNIQKAIKVDPNKPEYYRKRGSYYIIMGYPDRGIADFTRALEMNPNYFDVLLLRCNVLYATNRLEEALTDADILLRMQPANNKVWQIHGLINSMKGDHQSAVYDFTEALKLLTTNFVSYKYRAESYTALGHKKEAIGDWEKCLELFTNLAYRSTGETRELIEAKIKKLRG